MPYCDLVEICILMFPQKSGGTNAPPLMDLNCLLHQADQGQCHYAEHYAQYHRTLGQQFIHSFFLSPEKRFGSAGDRSRQTGALAGLENDRGDQRNRDLSPGCGEPRTGGPARYGSGFEDRCEEGLR